MINDSGLQVFFVVLIVVVEGIVVYWLTATWVEEGFQNKIKGWKYSNDRLSAANTKLLDDNGELEKEVKRLIVENGELRAKIELQPDGAQ